LDLWHAKPPGHAKGWKAVTNGRGQIKGPSWILAQHQRPLSGVAFAAVEWDGEGRKPWGTEGACHIGPFVEI